MDHYDYIKYIKNSKGELIMALLRKADLLKRDFLKIEKVDLGNDDYVYVRQMNGHEKDQFEQSVMKEVEDKKGNIQFKRDLSDFRAKLAVCTVCDEDGNNLLGPGDVEILSKSMSAAKLDKILEVAQRLNRITEEDKIDMVKNSATDQSEDNTSGSVEISDTPTPTTGSVN